MIPLLRVPPLIIAARNKWQYRGQVRPPFADSPAEGQESVWDFPRPPVIQDCTRRLEVKLKDRLIASTTRGRRVCETAGAPTYYFPPEDVLVGIEASGGQSLCEWKGVAESLTVAGVRDAGWRYIQMFAEFRELYLLVAFYPARLDCFVDDEPVSPQPGGYYGGWVTADLAGPIKGEPGSDNW